jgi:hypothetical protein
MQRQAQAFFLFAQNVLRACCLGDILEDGGELVLARGKTEMEKILSIGAK